MSNNIIVGHLKVITEILNIMVVLNVENDISQSVPTLNTIYSPLDKLKMSKSNLSAAADTTHSDIICSQIPTISP